MALNITRRGILAVYFSQRVLFFNFSLTSSICKKENLTFLYQLFGAVLYGLWLCLLSLSLVGMFSEAIYCSF